MKRNLSLERKEGKPAEKAISRVSSSRPVEARDNTDIGKTGHNYASVIRSTLTFLRAT